MLGLTKNQVNHKESICTSNTLYIYCKFLQDGAIYTWEDFGSIQWELVLGMLLTYIITIIILLRGVKSMGKASYAITIFPYVTLTILLIYGLTLPGASDGVDFYLSADWSRLGDTAIWTQACIQITMSLGIGLGMHMALATYNDSDEKILVDASAVATLNSATSIYAGLAVFAMMGFLAGESGSPIESVGFTHQEENLAFLQS